MILIKAWYDWIYLKLHKWNCVAKKVPNEDMCDMKHITYSHIKRGPAVTISSAKFHKWKINNEISLMKNHNSNIECENSIMKA